jgi:hypothetical protein
MDTRAWVGSIACSPCAARFEVRDSHRTLHVVTWQRRGTKTSQKLFHAKSSIPSNKHGYALRDSHVTTPTRT